MSLNGQEFILESEVFTVSAPISKQISKISVEGRGIYKENEDIIVDIMLFDINGELVPDGNYAVEVISERAKKIQNNYL